MMLRLLSHNMTTLDIVHLRWAMSVIIFVANRVHPREQNPKLVFTVPVDAHQQTYETVWPSGAPFANMYK